MSEYQRLRPALGDKYPQEFTFLKIDSLALPIKSGYLMGNGGKYTEIFRVFIAFGEIYRNFPYNYLLYRLGHRISIRCAIATFFGNLKEDTTRLGAIRPAQTYGTSRTHLTHLYSSLP